MQEDENAVESDEERTREKETEESEHRSPAWHLRLRPFRLFCLEAVNIVRSA